MLASRETRRRGVALEEPGQRRCNDELGDAGRRREPHLALGFNLPFLRREREAGRGPLHGFGVRAECLGDDGREDAIRRAVEQVGAHRGLESVKPARDRRRIHAELCGGTGERSRLQQRQQYLRVVPAEALHYCKHTPHFCALPCVRAGAKLLA
jgi:hypothetical protein